MSASLVGSEMCIRDRRRPRPWSRGSLGLGSTGGVSSWPMPRLTRQPSPCLLYTSDAADDM
eukprot:8072480-Alexandrium_andersonii.AAC.1